MSKCKYTYEEADKHVVLNDNDPDLRPIVLSLPKPPPLHLIDGYGLPPEEQRFQRQVQPRRLKDLEAEAVMDVKKDADRNKNRKPSLLLNQRRFWELLYSRPKELKKEIAFIRKTWWHRIHGYWFFNRGKPTYITGRHFYYLNFYKMDTDKGVTMPDYRDRDRKEYIFIDYVYTATETFEKLDKEGYAIKEKDGSYKMVDVGRRICYGKQQPKNRRSGNTNKGLCNGLEVITRTIGTDGAGIQSYSNDNAEEHFKVKLLPAWDSLPMWLKPYSKTGRGSDSLRLEVGNTDFDIESLHTKFTYATTASEKFYDGKRMTYLLTDESGKTFNTSVLKRHDVNKNCVAQGNGRMIFGYMDYPSTVDEMADGAFDYRFLSNTSNFYQRVKSSGQTFSGLFRLFIPATEGLDGFIDSYGYSVKDKIEPYQEKEGFKQTALDYLQGKRDALRAKADSESMRAYREERKLFPITYADCWLGEAGDLGLNLENIDNRLHELRRSNDVITGDLVWIDGHGGDVRFVEDEENGRFKISMMPPAEMSNKRTLIQAYSTFENGYINQYRPLRPGMFTLGADPFRFGNKQDAKMGSAKGKSSRLSDGGIAILWNFDPSMDGDKPIHEWESYRFVLSYRYRAANTDEYNEDVLKAAIYFGAMVYPETNVPSTYEYFIRHRYGGYLLYDTDKYTGKFKDKPGMDTLERSKQELFAMWLDYVENRCHKEKHEDILRELKDIRGIEEMRQYDLIAAGGMALMGAKSRYVEALNEINNNDQDLQDFLFF